MGKSGKVRGCDFDRVGFQSGNKLSEKTQWDDRLNRVGSGDECRCGFEQTAFVDRVAGWELELFFGVNESDWRDDEVKWRDLMFSNIEVIYREVQKIVRDAFQFKRFVSERKWMVRWWNIVNDNREKLKSWSANHGVQISVKIQSSQFWVCCTINRLLKVNFPSTFVVVMRLLLSYHPLNISTFWGVGDKRAIDVLIVNESNWPSSIFNRPAVILSMLYPLQFSIKNRSCSDSNVSFVKSHPWSMNIHQNSRSTEIEIFTSPYRLEDCYRYWYQCMVWM